jgi:hypothetical protein
VKENSIAEDIKMIEILKNKNLYINIKPKSSICIDCINKNKNKHIEAEVVINEKLEEAINYTLSDYKRVLKENEELRQERELVGLPVRNKRSGKIGIILHQWESGSIAVLENIRPRVINTHDNWNTLEIINDNVKQKRKETDCIPVQKVKDKIEELQNGPLKINENNKYYYETEAYNKIIIQVLQELLEGRK